MYGLPFPLPLPLHLVIRCQRRQLVCLRASAGTLTKAQSKG